MKLSDVVNYKIAIQNINRSAAHQTFYKFSKDMTSTLQTQAVDFGNIKSQILEDLEEIQKLFDKIDNNLYQYNHKLAGYVNTFADQYYKHGDDIYQSTLDDTAEYMLERSKTEGPFANSDNLKFFISRVKIYSDWRYPGMHIRPLGGEVSDCLKSFDPLYIVDTQNSLLDHAKTMWNQQYQNRVRYYVVNEQDAQPLKNLPQEQFGFVIATEFFNYKSIGVVEKYLRNIYQTLKPGGNCVFTFNDCDTVEGLRLVEANFGSYTPAHRIKEIVENIGYTIEAEFHRGSRLAWFEIRKPGQLTSIRDGQTLGLLKKLST